MANNKIHKLFPENNSFFKRRFINRKLRTANKHARYFDFSIARISVTKFGLRNVALNLKRKKHLRNREIPVGKRLLRTYIWENTHGVIRVGSTNSREYYHIQHYLRNDIKILHEHLIIH